MDHVASCAPIDKAARDAVLEQRRVERSVRLTRGRDLVVAPRSGGLVTDTATVIITPRVLPSPVVASNVALGAASYSGLENTNIQFQVQRAAGFQNRVAVDWAITGALAVPNTGTTTFQVGEGQRLVNIGAGEVAVDEAGTLTLSNPVNLDGGPAPVLIAPFTASFTVTDTVIVGDIDINLTASSYSGVENTNITFGIDRVGFESTNIVTVDWAIAGATVAPNTGTATFNIGETQKLVTVAATDVSVTEVGTLTLSNPQNLSGGSTPILVAPTTATFTVTVSDVTIDLIPSLSLAVGATHDMSQYINDTFNTRTSTEVTGLTTFASYDSGTELLTGLVEGTETGAQLVVDTVAQDTAWGYGVDEDGTTITGGRGLDPIYVTNLNDSGAGSLQAALASGTGGHILFEYGGIINRENASQNHSVENSGNKTVWGNTAPTGNINLHGGGATLFIDQANVIIKHLRIRVGDTGATPSINGRDGIRIRGNQGADDILIENCSVAGSCDELANINNSDTIVTNNVTFYRCLFAYPIRDSGHPDGAHNKGPLFENNSETAMIESVMAHTEGRPLVRAQDTFAALSTLTYMWDGQSWSFGSGKGAPADARYWVEGCRWIDNDAGIKTPNYTGSDQGTSAGTAITAATPTLNGSDMIYLANNDYDGHSPNSSLNVALVNLATAQANITLPTDYSSRFDVNFWSDANLSANIALVGANPTVSDTVDDDARNSIVNNTGVWIDSFSELPSGGLPSITARTHIDEDTFNGDTLQQHLESRSWWGTTGFEAGKRHTPASGYTNRTKLEAYLDTFVAGVPGTDPN